MNRFDTESCTLLRSNQTNQSKYKKNTEKERATHTENEHFSFINNIFAGQYEKINVFRFTEKSNQRTVIK